MPKPGHSLKDLEGDQLISFSRLGSLSSLVSVYPSVSACLGPGCSDYSGPLSQFTSSSVQGSKEAVYLQCPHNVPAVLRASRAVLSGAQGTRWYQHLTGAGCRCVP